ncbi:flagellar filament capping protein FliD [Halopseudomonas aestusnigri]|uniref:flagellar filament capping protein FliD n=1 Tax=Halopseudomonas aestusnigri TaxID=857252 RepID=UPI001E3159FA|nr:flagellar filament capping protein FliD [Halopseudomonas aestusnigri]UGV29533.1 flagellar filament capping protein FliD [Halopseudomonas aestusnigri]
MAITGIGSGLDISGIVSALVNAEGAPKTAQLDRLESTTTTKVSALGQFRSALSTFKSALSSLNDTSLYEKRTATSSASGTVSVSATSSAAAGSYKVQVFNLAQTSKVALAGFDTATDAIGSGTLTIDIGDDVLEVDVTDASLSDIRDAINAAGQSKGLSATIVTDPNGEGGSRLVLSSDKSGTGNDISVSVSSDATGDLADLAYTPPSGTDADFQPTAVDENNPRAARVISYSRDANLAIDGINMSSASNTVEDAVAGVSLTLNAAQSADAISNAESITLKVSADRDGVKKSINSFVDAYNAMLTSINSLTSVVAVGGDDSEPLAAALVGDSSVRSFMSSLRSEMGSTTSGSGIRILADLGVTTQSDGTLAVDNTKLNKALDSNLDQVGEFFAGDKGLMTRLDAKVDPYTKSDGILDVRTKALQNTLTNVDEQRETLATRLEKLETRLLAQFNAMDTLVSQMTSTSTYLTSQLENLPGVVKKD